MSGKSDSRKKKRKGGKKKKVPATAADAQADEKEVSVGATASAEVGGREGSDEGEADPVPDQESGNGVQPESTQATHVPSLIPVNVNGTQADAVSEDTHAEEERKPTLAEMAEEVVQPTEGAETLLSVASHTPGALAGTSDEDLAVIEQELRDNPAKNDSVAPEDSSNVLPADKVEDVHEQSVDDSSSASPERVEELPIKAGDDEVVDEKPVNLPMREEEVEDIELPTDKGQDLGDNSLVSHSVTLKPSEEDIAGQAEFDEQPETLLNRAEELQNKGAEHEQQASSGTDSANEISQTQQEPRSHIEETGDTAPVTPLQPATTDEHKQGSTGEPETRAQHEPVGAQRPQASVSNRGGDCDDEKSDEKTPLLSGRQTTSQQSASAKSESCCSCTLL